MPEELDGVAKELDIIMLRYHRCWSELIDVLRIVKCHEESTTCVRTTRTTMTPTKRRGETAAAAAAATTTTTTTTTHVLSVLLKKSIFKHVMAVVKASEDKDQQKEVSGVWEFLSMALEIDDKLNETFKTKFHTD